MTHLVFFPLVMTIVSILGVESIDPAAQVERIAALAPGYVRWNGVRWPDAIGYEQLDALSELDTRAIVVVQADKFIPDARQQEQIASLIADLSSRYPQIYAWEIWNEPDVPMFEGSSYFLGGGWQDDPGGYASFLSLVKRRNPGVRILAGGVSGVGDWIWSVFAAGALCDGVSFHSYTRTVSVSDLEQRVVRLRDMTDVPLYLTETALLSASGGAEHEAAKADYLRLLYDAARRLDLQSVIWYTVGGNGWEHSDLGGASWDLFAALR